MRPRLRYISKAYTLFFDYLGDVLMCPHDWGKKVILGNLNTQSFIDIWCSKLAVENREKLINGNGKHMPCNKCDVIGNLIGNQHVEAWSKYFEKRK